LTDIFEALDGVRLAAKPASAEARGYGSRGGVEQNAMEMKNRDKEAVVDILAKYASASPTGPIAFYKNLVQKADLPQTVKGQWVGTFTGHASQDARALVSSLLAFGTNP
jgi:hypothetical protein